MSLLGLDVGTSGCKAILFCEDGSLIASAYREYDIQRPQVGWAELDALDVWDKIQQTLSEVTYYSQKDPVRALSVSSLGEAMVPVTWDRKILGPSILNSDIRGQSYLQDLKSILSDEILYEINGNPLGNHYGLTKLMWIRDSQPEVYRKADKFLHWGSFVLFMLGADPVVDFSLANRSLLFDLEKQSWSEIICSKTGIDIEKLPETVPSGQSIGTINRDVADRLGLPYDTVILTGAHDQCANAVGCGVIDTSLAMYGMGTVICAVPVFEQRRNTQDMLVRGLNTEHHAVPGMYVSFIYNQGGALLKWFRDTFAAAERTKAINEGRDIYSELIREMPERASGVMVLPHFDPTGPPQFIADSGGVITGLHLHTTRGEILKGILEGATFYIRESLDTLPDIGIDIDSFRAVGGGTKSNEWVQLSADILGKPFIRPQINEAGALGAAILAGTGIGTFKSLEEGCQAMVKLDRVFEPDPKMVPIYQDRFNYYQQLWPLLAKFLRENSTTNH